MVVVVAPPPEAMIAAMRTTRNLKKNVGEMRKAFKSWQLTKSNAQMEPLLVEVVESVDAMYAFLKKRFPEEF